MLRVAAALALLPAFAIPVFATDATLSPAAAVLPDAEAVPARAWPPRDPVGRLLLADDGRPLGVVTAMDSAPRGRVLSVRLVDPASAAPAPATPEN